MDAEKAPSGDGGRSETVAERADRNWNELLQEVRITQTGTQILGGFLLAVAFQPRFEELDEYQLVLYLVLVALAGLATALGLSLVALHRRYFRKRRKMNVVRIGNRLLVANLLVVALLAAGVTGLVFDFVVGRTVGAIALLAGLVVSFGLWASAPLMGREGDHGGSRPAPGSLEVEADAQDIRMDGQ